MFLNNLAHGKTEIKFAGYFRLDIYFSIFSSPRLPVTRQPPFLPNRPHSAQCTVHVTPIQVTPHPPPTRLICLTDFLKSLLFAINLEIYIRLSRCGTARGSHPGCHL